MINYTGLYSGLLPIALGVVSRSVHGVDLYDMKEIAHDITTDFLLFSKSFKKTFDKKRGSLEAFFSSYARKKCYRVREGLAKERNHRASLSNEVLNHEIVEDKFVKWEEIIDQLNLYKRVLSGQLVSGVDLGDLLGYCLLCFIEEGKLVKSRLAENLGVSRKTATKALDAMKQRLLLYR